MLEEQRVAANVVAIQLAQGAILQLPLESHYRMVGQVLPYSCQTVLRAPVRSHDCHLRYKASLRVRWPLG